mmetsp:Transcript_70212/g.196812  ORF Transcript_70212/g.196812 Transcript_70212/m.196812 type:complete len:215 (+) Transcript_70212:44-688(+)
MAAERRKLLVLGSSVAAGHSCEPLTQGWAHLLARAIEPKGVDTVNLAVSGTTVKLWAAALADEELRRHVASSDVVLMSLSLGNEGLSSMRAEAEAGALVERYIDGYHGLAKELRRLMARPGARLVLGGPYPNNGYTSFHLQGLNKVYAAARGWKEVDYVIDFLGAPLHDSRGHWGAGLMADEGHPNEDGHRCMYDLVDLGELLGPHDVDRMIGS